MRPQDHHTLMSLANKAAHKSNCIRRAVGAVIIRQGQLVVEGWNGVSESHKDCREAGCPRCINGGDTGSGYETCICVHAEQRAIGDAAKRGVSTKDCVLYVNLRPCLQCLAISKAAGIREVFYSGEPWTYPAEIERVYSDLSGEFDSFLRIDERRHDYTRLAAGSPE